MSARRSSASRNERSHEPAVGVGVAPEPLRGRVYGALEEDGRAVVERVGQRRRRLDPLEAVPLELERLEERGAETQWMYRGADVVAETRERELLRSHPTAHGRRRLQDEHGAARARQQDRGGEAVRPGADDDRVVHLAVTRSAASASSRCDAGCEILDQRAGA